MGYDDDKDKKPDDEEWNPAEFVFGRMEAHKTGQTPKTSDKEKDEEG